jgi:hypothetical protein
MFQQPNPTQPNPTESCLLLCENTFGWTSLTVDTFGAQRGERNLYSLLACCNPPKSFWERLGCSLRKCKTHANNICMNFLVINKLKGWCTFGGILVFHSSSSVLFKVWIAPVPNCAAATVDFCLGVDENELPTGSTASNLWRKNQGDASYQHPYIVAMKQKLPCKSLVQTLHDNLNPRNLYQWRLRSGVADYVIFLTTLYAIIFPVMILHTHNRDQNLSVEHGFFLELLNLPPQPLMSWTGNALAHYVGCVI